VMSSDSRAVYQNMDDMWVYISFFIFHNYCRIDKSNEREKKKVSKSQKKQKQTQNFLSCRDE
jgi:hypothetical protein